MENNRSGKIPEEFELLKTSKTRLTYFKNETIFKQGAFAPYVIYILEGLVKISLETGPGKAIHLRLAGKGDFLALSAIFGESRYVTTAVALKDTLTCMMDKESLSELLISNPKLALHINTQSFNEENRLISLIKSLSYNQMRGKLASALLYLSADRFVQEGVFELLSRQDLAQFAGISLESTVKFLKEFDQDKIIRVHGREISVVNMPALTELGLHA